MRADKKHADEVRRSYVRGVQDAIDRVDRITKDAVNSKERFLGRMISSELRSLHPGANERRERTKADTLEQVVDSIAEKVIQAAQDDIAYGEERGVPPGNVVANVTFSFPAVCQWLHYASTRGSAKAVGLLEHIADRRSPSIPWDETHAAAKVYRVSQSDYTLTGDG